VRSKSPLGDLACGFNEMAIALERLSKEEAVRLRLRRGELQLQGASGTFVPTRGAGPSGVTLSGQTWRRGQSAGICTISRSRRERIGILCADVSGKGIRRSDDGELQAIARARLSDLVGRLQRPPLC